MSDTEGFPATKAGIARSRGAPSDQTPSQRRLLARFGVALITTAASVLLRAAITPVLGNRIPFLTFFPAITVTSWYGGFWPGVFCTLLSAGIVGALMLESTWRLVVEDFGDIVALAIFIGTGVMIAALNETLHRQRARLQLAHAEAERAAAAAERAYSEAAAANCAKDQFLSVLSHELRTPLTSILGWASTLRTREVGASTIHRALETIERNALGQARLIDDLLDVNRIITGKLRLDIRPTDPADVIRAAVDVVRPAAEAKHITLDAVLDREAGTILADPDRLLQIMWNLLSNAVKFTPEGGRVVARLDSLESQLRIRVTDTGKGISQEFLSHVFERFTQADPTTTRVHGGLGLGLAIVKHLVDLHGGTITAESGGAGEGSTFTIIVPTGAAELPDARRDHVRDRAANARPADRVA